MLTIFRSTLAGVLRVIFLSVAYPLGRLTFGYSAPSGTPTPLVLQVFNPTFWVMVEMGLGVWAANLPALSPLMKNPRKYLRLGRTWRKLSGSGPKPENSRTLTVSRAGATQADSSHAMSKSRLHHLTTGQSQTSNTFSGLGLEEFDSYEMSQEPAG